jgi:hypothetical protein
MRERLEKEREKLEVRKVRVRCYELTSMMSEQYVFK